jgi:hypothetical protein
MRTEEDFKAYFDSNLLHFLKEFDKKRKPLINYRLINLGLLVLLIPLFIYTLSLGNGEFTAWTILCLIPIGLMVWIGIKRYQIYKDFRDEYKNKVIKEIVKLVDPELQYDYESRISDNEFYHSQIYLTSADRSTGEDLIYGKIDKTAIKFSELHLEYKTESTDSDGHHQTQWHTIFKGIFFIADFNKNFKTQTVVLPDGLERIFGKFARKLQKMTTRRGNLIQLENPLFEKYFKVYAEDAIESRYILTPALMERITNFRVKTGLKVAFSFVDSNIYIALPIQKNLFEPRVFKNLYSYEFIKESFSYLMLFTGIVEELNLNTRIWTKE